MALATLTPDSGAAVDSLAQIGNLPVLQIQSGSAQRLGSRQPIWWQSGTRSPRETIEFSKTVSDQATAIAARDALRAMQGQRVVVLDNMAETKEIMCIDMKAEAKEGAQKWLVTGVCVCEGMPSTPTPPTTP